MRVALVTVGDTTRPTGGYLYHARLLGGLRERGVEVEEFVPCGASAAEQEVAAPGFRLDPGRFDVIVVDALARVVCAPYLDRWRGERPVVALVHELPSVAGPGGAFEREREEPLLRCERLVAVSEHGGTILTARGGPPDRIRVVPPGRDRLATGFAGGTGGFAAGEGPVRVLCVAQWIPRKGIVDLVRAWTRRERPGARLSLVGETDADPDYAESVYAALAQAPTASVTVAGPVDDAVLAALYASSDLFALPSRYEGYGTVYAEALACGLPVIACDVGPVPALVGEEAALLVAPGDVDALGSALDHLIEDARSRRRMSIAARRRARELPGWEETVERFFGVLWEAARERSRRRL